MQRRAEAEQIRDIWMRLTWSKVLIKAGALYVLSAVLGRMLFSCTEILFGVREDQLLFSIYQNIILAVLVVKYWQYEGCDLRFFFGRLKMRDIALSVLAGIGICIVLLLASREMNVLWPQHLTTQRIIATAEQARSWQTIAKVCFLGVIAAPVSEEILFRGFLYQGLAEIIDKRYACVWTSVLFGALHFDLYRFAFLTMAAVFLNILREKNGSLYSSMIAHATWNALMLGLAFWI